MSNDNPPGVALDQGKEDEIRARLEAQKTTSPKAKQAWAEFFLGLRKRGYWGSPEKFRPHFDAFFSDYLSRPQNPDGGGPYSLEWQIENAYGQLGITSVDGHTEAQWEPEELKFIEMQYVRLLPTCAQCGAPINPLRVYTDRVAFCDESHQQAYVTAGGTL